MGGWVGGWARARCTAASAGGMDEEDDEEEYDDTSTMSAAAAVAAPAMGAADVVQRLVLATQRQYDVPC